MAERAFETPEHFLKYVVEPNLKSFREAPDSLNAAFNCVMSLDALAGHIFVEYMMRGKTTAKDDSAFREELSKEDVHFELIRDAAKTYKHIQLNRGTPSITNAKQSKVSARPYGSGAFGVGSYGGMDVIIELDDGTEKHCISEALSAYDFLSSKL